MLNTSARSIYNGLDYHKSNAAQRMFAEHARYKFKFPTVKHTPLARSRSQNQVGPKTKYMGILFNETYSQRDLLHMATKSRGSIGSANPYDSEVLLSKNLIGICTK